MSTQFSIRTNDGQDVEFATRAAGWRFSFTAFTLFGVTVRDVTTLREFLAENASTAQIFGDNSGMRLSPSRFWREVEEHNGSPRNTRNLFTEDGNRVTLGGWRTDRWRWVDMLGNSWEDA